MCGIVGLVGAADSTDLEATMRDSLAHRGPDRAGDWSDPVRGVWLGHRRLAILDLSPEGDQPMRSASGRYAIVYNGEIFNHESLRAELIAQGARFRGRSDTEVMLAAIEAWGLAVAVRRFVGMFAFGLWDRDESRLWLVRDRVGVKPLYYAYSGSRFAFASELRALKRLPWLDDELDRDALVAYLRHLYVPEPATIIRGARKLRPGTMLSWDGRTTREFTYWSLLEAVRLGTENRLTGSLEEAVDELDERLRQAVRLRMQADVPLGAFLSGGVDSSTVVALMQSQSAQPVQTFTIGFAESSHDEAPHARRVAEHLGTEHHEEVLSAEQVIDLVPFVAELHDEPFADGSSVPTYLLSRFTRRRVTVALSGDGGDELFGGYPRYYWASRIQRWQGLLGRIGSRGLAQLVDRLPLALLDGPISRLCGARFAGTEGLAPRVRRFFQYVATPPGQVYDDVVAAWGDPGQLVGYVPRVRLGPDPAPYGALPWAEQMMAVDQEHQLVGDFLTKIDRTSMAVSLEVRVPLLDHRLVEWSWRVPPEFKLNSRGDRGKRILRAVLDRYVPRELTDRPKMGFGMPMGRWLRRELRPWAENLLSPDRIRGTGVLAVDPVRRAWQEHLDGVDRLPQIWTALMFLQWSERWRASAVPA
jgi:asparagine synthase (glutamine-hydrolysing)